MIATSISLSTAENMIFLKMEIKHFVKALYELAVSNSVGWRRFCFTTVLRGKKEFYQKKIFMHVCNLVCFLGCLVDYGKVSTGF